jgi:glycosyltransferase involved in cell wall biosynthesis
MSPTVAIFRNELLPRSETFIADQARTLRRFVPLFVGMKRVGGHELAGAQVVLSGDGLRGRAERARIRLLGPPRCHLRAIRSYRPSLVHAHFGIDGIVGASLSRSLRVPLVVTFHGYDATTSDDVFRRGPLAERLYVWRRPQLIARTTTFICVSEYIRAQVIARGIPPDRAMVHYTGIDTSFFRPDPAIAREPVVLFVGRLVEKKGCEYLIHAMAEVQEQHRAAKLVIIGDGPLRAGLERLAHPQNVRFLGSQPSAVVREWMNRAMVFSTPSIVAKDGDAEGFGMVFAEAQCMGTPVASFATGGIPEAVQDGETGLLAPERDTRGLARNILALLTDAALWQRLSDAGRVRVARFFDLQRQTDALESIYDAAIAQGPRS